MSPSSNKRSNQQHRRRYFNHHRRNRHHNHNNCQKHPNLTFPPLSKLHKNTMADRLTQLQDCINQVCHPPPKQTNRTFNENSIYSKPSIFVIASEFCNSSPHRVNFLVSIGVVHKHHNNRHRRIMCNCLQR